MRTAVKAKRITALIISLITIFSVILLSTLLPQSFVKADTVSADKTVPDELSPSAMEQAVKNFLNISEQDKDGNRGGRATFSESEKLMADAIFEYALSLNTAGEPATYSVSRQHFTVDLGTDGKGTSQNIIVKKVSKTQNAKQVVFLANYDNETISSESSLNFLGNLNQTEEAISGETGAMDNATGCGVLYALLNYYKNVDIDVNLVFIFCGAGNYYNSGSDYYVSQMTQTEVNNTLLAFGFRRFGGDNVYMYNEEVKTGHGEFLLQTAEENALSVLSTPKNMPIINAVLIDRLPYAHFAMIGPQASFMQEHINVASIFSAYYSGMNIADIESKYFDRRSGTADDTFTYLKADFPEYKNQMSEAAVLAIKAIERSDFASAMSQSRQDFNYYDAATKKPIVQFSILGVCIAIVLSLFFVSNSLNKKYPFVPPKQINLKLAVFGKDYEEEKEGEHIIDLDPFGGKGKPLDPFE